MLVLHAKLYHCFKRLLFLFLCFAIVVFLLHPGRFASSYEFIDSSEIWRHLVTVSPPENMSKPFCPVLSHLGNTSAVNLHSLKFNKTQVRPGGRWEPHHCLAQHKIALIVSYRNRKKHLDTFIDYMHGFLQAQLIEYSIYVVEQTPKLAFNRGLLSNIGYSIALEYEQIPCFIFHDVDLLPENLDNIYSCTSMPRHFSSSVNTLRYRLPYGTLFGGVVALLQAQFQMVNGFPNRYFGWGGEDDDLFMRVINKGMNIVRFSPELSRYYMLPHIKEPRAPENEEKLQHVTVYQDRDGLSDYRRYCASIKEVPKPLFMHILADVQLPKEYNMVDSW